MTHFIEKCECGKVLSQCRCADKNKFEKTVSPCVHKETGALDEEEYEPKHMQAMRSIDE